MIEQLLLFFTVLGALVSVWLACAAIYVVLLVIGRSIRDAYRIGVRGVRDRKMHPSIWLFAPIWTLQRIPEQTHAMWHGYQTEILPR